MTVAPLFDLLSLPFSLFRWAFIDRSTRFFSYLPFDERGWPEEPPDLMVPERETRNADRQAALPGVDKKGRNELRHWRFALKHARKRSMPSAPDPISYILPKSGSATIALIPATALSRKLWQKRGARLATASSDHLGFEVGQPCENGEEAKTVMTSFFNLGADEVNSEYRKSRGDDLIWWD